MTCANEYAGKLRLMKVNGPNDKCLSLERGKEYTFGTDLNCYVRIKDYNAKAGVHCILKVNDNNQVTNNHYFMLH